MKLLYGNCTVRYNARSVRFRLIRLIGTRVWIYKINLYFQLSGFISCRIFGIYGHAISSIGSSFHSGNCLMCFSGIHENIF